MSVKRTTQSKAATSKAKPLSRKDALSAVRTARKSGSHKRPASSTWKKGGREYSKVLGHFGLSSNHTN